jgi:hypothetical protein
MRTWRAAKPAALACALACAVLALGGCGSSSSRGVAQLSPTKRADTTAAESGAAGAAGPANPAALAVAYAKCMRANGVANFPEPSGGGGLFRFGAGVDPTSPAFKIAQAVCHKLMPGAGIGSGPPPSAQTLARFLKIAQCMREHGIYRFPDPMSSVPSNPFHGGYGVISDIEGVIFVFPSTIDEQSPAFTQAAAACTFPLHNH